MGKVLIVQFMQAFVNRGPVLPQKLSKNVSYRHIYEQYLCDRAYLTFADPSLFDIWQK